VAAKKTTKKTTSKAVTRKKVAATSSSVLKKKTTRKKASKKTASKKAPAKKKPTPHAAIASPASGFQPGHQLWKLRATNGGPRKYETPEELIEACCQYFQWVEDNPFRHAIQCSYEGLFTHDFEEKPRPMTKKALYVHLGISHTTWASYSEEGHVLAEVCDWVDNVIYTQKFEGAATGFFNANIISRDLQLNDTSKLVTDDGKGGNAPLPATPVVTLPSNGREADTGTPLPEEKPNDSN